MMLLSERGLVVILVIIKSVLWIGGGVCSDVVDWCKFEATEADDDRIQLLLSEVKGKDITELIASGREKLASVPSGGGGAIAVTSYGGGSCFAQQLSPRKRKRWKRKRSQMMIWASVFLTKGFIFLLSSTIQINVCLNFLLCRL
ncbi:hypothetical protein LOK49_LG10G01449 [Camellia lanceoleosa]|uniref:Uncharacterized protein n=1 Tax=Camellia lanceoleosa TaxID=1840588 RepID=A0ACC0G574_9ERIC|nr:hypothetical protein LOK49_LG10G01449 [Camellia lanceoleosa]